MKKIIDAIRDFLYNITDYGLIITVILVMAVILGWRFEILFNRGIEKEVIDNLPEVVVGKDDDDPVNPVPSNPDDSKEPGQNDDTDEPANPSDNEVGSGLIATINIPEGSFPSSIGDILLNSNLIDDKNAFLDRSVELGLDTRLRSGTFEIEVGTSLDNVIKIIANAN